MRKERVGTDEPEAMGPIDYVVIEWKDRQPSGEAAPILVDLVERGIVRVLDLAFMTKDEDGSVGAIDLAELGHASDEMGLFEGASSGLLGDEDIKAAAEALKPGTTAAVIVYENRWAAPFAAAVRRSGGELVASERIPADAFLAALDAADEAAPTTS